MQTHTQATTTDFYMDTATISYQTHHATTITVSFFPSVTLRK